MEYHAKITCCLVLLISSIVQNHASNVDNFLVEIMANSISYEWVTFTNWASTVTTSNVILIRPTSKEQVQLLVRFAKDNQGDQSIGELPLRVRTMGSAHSFSDMFADEQSVVLNMTYYETTALDRMYIVDSSDDLRPYYTVAVNPSVSTQEMLDYMATNGLSLPSLAGSYQPSPIGLIGVGGHGMNWQDGPIGSQLESIMLITGQGDFRSFNVLQHGEIFNLFRSHVGLCGVIIQVTFKAVSHQLMSHHYNVRFPISQVFDNITTLTYLLNEHHSWLATWDLFSSLNSTQISDMVSNGGITSDWDPASDYIQNNLFKELSSATSTIVVAAYAGTMYDDTVTLSDNTVHNATLQYRYYPSFSAMDNEADGDYPIHSEFAFSVDSTTFTQMTSVLQILQDDIKAYATSHSTLPLKNVQFSFMQHNSTCYFCHTNVANSTVNSHAASGNLVFIVNFKFYISDITEFNTLIETLYTDWTAANLQGLPHWGKYIPDVDTIRSDLVTLMKPRINEFNVLRTDAHLDDIDMFTNNFLDSIVFVDKDRVVNAGSSQSDGRRCADVSGTVLMFSFVFYCLVFTIKL